MPLIISRDLKVAITDTFQKLSYINYTLSFGKSSNSERFLKGTFKYCEKTDKRDERCKGYIA